MSKNFTSGLQMGMGLARDVRSANIASAERKERSKYRETAEARAASAEGRAVSGEARAVSAEKRAVNLDKSRIKSLKQGMRRGRKADKRSGRELEIKESAEERAVAESAQRVAYNKSKLEDAKNPIITALDHNAGALEKYSKMQSAVDARNADKMGPLNAVIRVAEKTNSPNLPNLLAMREKMVSEHKDYKHGLEQSFMAASNRPHEGKWSIRPQNNWNGGVDYGLQFEGGSQSEAIAAMNSIKGMGSNVGASAGANPANPARAANPNDPGDIRRPPAP
jgi:hypothetical protein